MIFDRIEELKRELESAGANLADAAAVEQFRITYLSRKGAVARLFEELKQVDREDKPRAGKELNALRQLAQQFLDTAAARLEEDDSASGDALDPTLPGRRSDRGHMHIVSRTIEEIGDIFRRMGFSIADVVAP